MDIGINPRTVNYNIGNMANFTTDSYLNSNDIPIGCAKFVALPETQALSILTFCMSGGIMVADTFMVYLLLQCRFIPLCTWVCSLCFILSDELGATFYLMSQVYIFCFYNSCLFCILLTQRIVSLRLFITRLTTVTKYEIVYVINLA